MMSSQDYGVRVVVAYANQSVGRVIFPPGVLRERLIKNGFVEPVEAPPGLVERITAGRVARPARSRGK